MLGRLLPYTHTHPYMHMIMNVFIMYDIYLHITYKYVYLVPIVRMKRKERKGIEVGKLRALRALRGAPRPPPPPPPSLLEIAQMLPDFHHPWLILSGSVFSRGGTNICFGFWSILTVMT